MFGSVAGVPNRLDCDSDDDGSLDSVEGDTTKNTVGLPVFLDPSMGAIGEEGGQPACPSGLGLPDCDEDGLTDGEEGSGDSDGDGLRDLCDPDSDNDGLLDSYEAFGGLTRSESMMCCLDTDNDGTPDYLDLDSDGDGIPDAAEGINDADGDGVPNYLDLDSDGDGVPDLSEVSAVHFIPR